jgi:SAM-dependent methyltransferase
MTLEQVSLDDIESMSYPDFVGYLRQQNTPPGAIDTIFSWIQWSGISKDSFLLDVACSTGFSSRSAARLTNCRGIGIDLSHAAIYVAAEESTAFDLQDRLTYIVGDVVNIPCEDQTFSHALAGCSFSFMQEKKRALREVYRVLSEGAALCVANFFYDSTPDSNVIGAVEETIGFKPEIDWTYSFWHDFLSDLFKMEKSVFYDLPTLDESTLYRKVENVISHSAQLNLPNVSLELRKLCFNRLLNIRRVLNQQRLYQKYAVEIWRKV